jgi:hypothetical protein
MPSTYTTHNSQQGYGNRQLYTFSFHIWLGLCEPRHTTHRL